jgi:hypothetical protein
MELWKVEVEWRDRLATPDQLHAKSAGGIPIPRREIPAYAFPLKRATIMVAVPPNLGSWQISMAGELAIVALIGPKPHSEPWEPWVVSAKYCGGVHVGSAEDTGRVSVWPAEETAEIDDD